MATFIAQTSFSVAPNYFGTAYKDPGVPETWANIRTQTGEDSYWQSMSTRLYTSGFETFNSLHRSVVGIDMSSLPSFLRPAGASLWVHTTNLVDTFGANWSTTNKSVVMVLLDESEKDTEDSEDKDYTAAGADLTEVSAVYAQSAFTIDDWTEIELNATGLDYLETVSAKSEFPGNAYFALSLVGDVRDDQPTFVSSGSVEYDFWKTPGGALEPYFYMTYVGMDMQLNVGDDWKDVTDMRINVGDSWKVVDNLKLNVGDDWKEGV